MTTIIEQLHNCYVEQTGLQVNLRVHERAWMDFIEHGYTVDDLRLVLQHLKRENRRMECCQFSVRLDRLLDFEYRHFDSMLAEARAIERNRRRVTPAEKVVAQWHGPLPEGHTRTDTSKTVKELLKTLHESV